VRLDSLTKLSVGCPQGRRGGPGAVRAFRRPNLAPPSRGQRRCRRLTGRDQHRADALSHATVVDGNTVFTFDTGDVLIVENIADPNLLRDDIAIV
jgi:hypothetical protein